MVAIRMMERAGTIYDLRSLCQEASISILTTPGPFPIVPDKHIP